MWPIMEAAQLWFYLIRSVDTGLYGVACMWLARYCDSFGKPGMRVANVALWEFASWGLLRVDFQRESGAFPSRMVLTALRNW